MAYPGYGAPPGGQDPLYGYFSAVAGQDGQISADELQQCLTQSGISGSYKPYNLEACRLTIGMLDRDMSVSMGFHEFKELSNVLNHWKTTFLSYDRDRSGTVGGPELQQALTAIGFNLSPQIVNIIMKRYSKHGRIGIEDFISYCVQLKPRTDPDAPAAVQVKMLKYLQQTAGLQQQIEKLELENDSLQIQLMKKDYHIRELMKKIPEASDTDAKHVRKQTKAPQISISDESSEESDGRWSSALSDSSERRVEVVSKKRRVKHKKPSHSQKGEKSPAARDHCRVRVKNTKGILSRYMKALEAFKEGTSMKTAFNSVGVDRCTIARTAAIVELKIAAPDVFNALPPWNDRMEKLSTFVDRCRKAMTPEIKEKIIKMKSENELLPFNTTP